MTQKSSFRTVKLSEPSYECSGLRFMTIKTPNLLGRGNICVYVPEVPSGVSDLPIYILLHGVYGSAWSWALNGGAHVTAQKLMDENKIAPAIIAMPSDGLWGDGSGYFSHHKKHFGKWIVEDVPTAVIENISTASDKSKICIGGLSMGGYGALMLGSQHASRFSAIAGHSSITELSQFELFVEEPMDEYFDECKVTKVFDSLLGHRSQLPPFRFDCGSTDLLIEPNRRLHQQLIDAGIDHIYEEYEGEHEWPYWQKNVTHTLCFFDRHVK